ncbi:AMP-binding protein [Gordonia sp. CPCC 205333]|uniref:AMP-binding protein n=1 Tax=Gordonia sp. CPCC 205333 TaxID=3140790 RepID=UPI003AF3B156
MDVTQLRAVWKQESESLKILRGAGAIPSVRAIPALGWAGIRGGVAAAGELLGIRHGDAVALIDPRGALTYRQLGAASNSLINGLRTHLAPAPRPTVGLMCRNSRYSLLCLFAVLGVGAKLVLLNTDMGPKQMAEVCRREKIDIVIYDAEFAPAFAGLPEAVDRLIAWPADGETSDIDRLIDSNPSRLPPRPAGSPSIVMLTSGSSGTPKGASRDSNSASERPSLAMVAGFLQKIPLRGEDRIFLAPPVFHGWGAIVAGSALMLGATIVFDRRFDPQQALELIVRHRCSAVITVPTMLRRLMSLPSEQLARIDRSALRIVGSGGAKLDTALVRNVLDEFGPVMYNLYGATEASFITIATPQDLLAEPACSGSAPIGVRVKILANGQSVAAGERGDIYVGSAGTIATYTDSTSKESVDGMIKTGDVGRLDAAGRLFIEGRSDGMIVSGGENVFPEELELVLAAHPDVADAKVVAVPDADFGQRLRVFVVAASGATISAEVLKDYVSQELSRSRVPRDVIEVPELPRTATGKVTKATLETLAEIYA